ncbi:MAG: methionine--tRNA ligase subunit beta [Phycisphaerae bacterium]|jgi:methionyl-tRNA synthetase
MSDAPATISYEEFAKVDLRVATVLKAEPHPNADRLLVLQVDLGGEQRQLIAGIRTYYEPAALVGRQVIVVANLAARAMRGVESRGMLLAAVSPDRTQLSLLTTDRPAQPGTRVS